MHDVIALDTHDGEPLGEVAEQYATSLLTALIRAGARGRITRSQYPDTDPRAHEGPHTRWPFLQMHLSGQQVRAFVMPTSQGVVLVVDTPSGLSLCLPTWGAPAAAFGAATLAVATQPSTAGWGSGA